MFLKVTLQTGEVKYLESPIVMHRQEGNTVNILEYGENELLVKIAMPKTLAISTKGSGLLLCKPFQSLEWVEDMPKTMSDNVLDQLKKGPGRPKKSSDMER